MRNSPKSSNKDVSDASVSAWHEADSEDSKVEQLIKFLISEVDVPLRHVGNSHLSPVTSNVICILLHHWEEEAQESKGLKNTIKHIVWYKVPEIKKLSLGILIPFEVTHAHFWYS